jgi:CubicO group peptidase (beta-lactamase class C family)
MDNWLKPALDYILQWLEYQKRESEQPGCVIAIAHQGRVVLERAFGYADIVERIPLTPRHRFRVASHSKSFTAAGIMKLREAESSASMTVSESMSRAPFSRCGGTIGQLLSLTAPVSFVTGATMTSGRTGVRSSTWAPRRPWGGTGDRGGILGSNIRITAMA